MDIASLFPLGVFHYIAGGICIGLATSLIFIFTGQVAGMSSFLTTSLSWVSRHHYFHQQQHLASRHWRLLLAIGLIAGAALYWFVFAQHSPWHTQVQWWQLAVGGFIAGFGARLSSGCTSGHGICGMASLHAPSLFAVLTFLATAFISANLITLLGGL